MAKINCEESWHYDEKYGMVSITLDNGDNFRITVDEKRQVIHVHKTTKSFHDSITVMPVVSNVIEIK
jgi:hypothetical protein